MPDEDADKRYDPTPHHLEQARKKGNVPKSADMVGILTLIGGLAVLLLGWNHIVKDLGILMGEVLKIKDLTDAFPMMLKFLFKWILIFAIPVASLSILGHVAQNAVVFTTEAISPKFDRINPAKNFKNLFSPETLVMAIKALITMCVLFTVILISTRRMSTLIVGATIELQPFIRTAFIAMAPLILWFAFLSIGDVIFTRIRHKHKLKMSVKEMKEELKQTEGDPLVKQQQSSFRKALLDGSLEDNVAEANVVITNPVHLAIAIKYEPDEFPAPLIVAKGARKMAEKIKKIARENKVPIVENPPVAQLLYRTVNKGDAIPPKYYQVVAEILAYVMTEGAGSYAV